MLAERYSATKSWVIHYPRLAAIVFLGFLSFGIIIFQFLYPTNVLVPFSSIENVSLGGWSKNDASKLLDEKLKSSQVVVHFSTSGAPFFKTTPSELGISASNQKRVQAIDYAWYWRLIPGSLFWVHFFTNNTVGVVQYERNQETLTAYINNRFGENCQLNSIDATLEVKNGSIQVTEAQSGGDCDFEELKTILLAVEPMVEGAKVTITGKEIAPTITTKAAEELAEHVRRVTKDGVVVNDGKTTHTIDKGSLLSWMDFGVIDGKLDYTFNADRAKTYLDEKIGVLVAKSPGVSTVATYDFQETSRIDGQSGVTLDEVVMLASIKTALEKGQKEVAAEMKVVPPTVQYTRSYSPTDTGLSAVMKNYADTHSGTYAVSLRELSGARRNASYRAGIQYTTASTFKLFVAYSTLLRIESGSWHWSDQIDGGRDVTKCFDDMIVKSDNACAEALLAKIGFKDITNEAKAIGCVNTSFLGSDGVKSTANDEALLLSLLQTGQILDQQTNRDVWINAMKRNVYRKGIPKGVPSAVVANKVGFLDDLLHDASIVYAVGGDTYVLVIMTQGASWANIAELTSQIETLRTQ